MISLEKQRLKTMLFTGVLFIASCGSDTSSTTDGSSFSDTTNGTDTQLKTDTEPTNHESDFSDPDTQSTDTGSAPFPSDDSNPDPDEKDAGLQDAGPTAPDETSTDTEADAGEQPDFPLDTETETDSDTESEETENPVIRVCEEDCLDFPAAPFILDNLTEYDVSHFETGAYFEQPGPCIIEPQLSDGINPGALFPANWLRPRFRFEPPVDTNLFEIRLQAERQKYDLLVYTTETTWEMPNEIWQGLTASVLDEPITVTIRALNRVNPLTPKGTQGTFSIAPVRADGKLVYWATTSSNVEPDTSKLAGFAVGEEKVLDVLTVDDVGDRDILSTDGRQERSPSYGVEEGCVQCIGCHVATPDGEAVAFGDHWPWNVVVASVQDQGNTAVELGKAPTYLTQGAEILLNQPWLGMPTFSPAHWNENERILITSYGERVTESGETVGFTHNTPTQDVLAWFDLHTDVDVEISADYEGDVLPERNRLVENALDRGFGMLSLIGETLSAVAPNWSHDGNRIVYTAAAKTVDGRLGGGASQTDVDIHMVPFNDGLGGPVSALQGAAEKETAEYYPSFSPDDTLIVFNREENFRATKTVTTFFYPPYSNMTIDGSQAAVYYRPHAEIYVIPSKGGTPIRLIANDPPQCTGETSPGVINSWGKWAPEVKTSSETFGPARSFYWVVFSSARDYPEQFIVERNQYSPIDTRSSQLYMAAIVRNEETGEYTNYPAIYLWNQDKETSNLTPAWDRFKLPSSLNSVMTEASQPTRASE